MQLDDDIKFMERCLSLASNSEGRTYPNPLVGSVIVSNGKIIGEGYHLKSGGPHAEVIAINSVLNKEELSKSTLYVNLEPCSHYGKTPPCTELIISSGIRRVVAGTTDTSDKVSGRGFLSLKDSGCDVLTGVLEAECRWINRRFFTFHEKKRPYIILKWAQSADGLIDAERTSCHIREPLWITGNAERILVHRWRASEQAILAGAGTVRCDDPRLNVRDWTGQDPLRIILSSSGEIDVSSCLLKSDGRTIMFTHNVNAKAGRAQIIKLDSETGSASQIAGYLYESGIQSLIVEGGAKVLGHFISEDLWDEARIFTGKVNFKKGVCAPSVHGRSLSGFLFGGSSLEVIVNDHNRS